MAVPMVEGKTEKNPPRQAIESAGVPSHRLRGARSSAFYQSRYQPSRSSVWAGMP